MGWIKRNLFFVIGGVVALGLLGAAGFYTYGGWSRNSKDANSLNEIYGTLQRLQRQSPAPGNDKINNTAIARKQQKQEEAWIASSAKYFHAVPSIPSGNVTSEAFASALRRTIDQLQREAKNANVTLPPKYDFSFSAQRPLVKFAVGSLNSLASQLGEVKAISETVFSGRVNALDSIQRVRVSEDDMTGPQGDYISKQPVTNDLAILTPYVVTFRSFTPELARVISAFATSSNAFLIKAINVAPASASPAAGTPGAEGVGTPGGGYYPAGAYRSPEGYVPAGEGYHPPAARPNRYGQYGAAPAGAPAYQRPVSRGGLQTVLKEQLLRVTMEVDIVKLLPKKS